MKAIVDASIYGLLIDYVNTFNDCACCPCYPECERGRDDSQECADTIFEKYLNGKYIEE